MDRRIRTETEFFDSTTQWPIGDGQSITEFYYSDASQVVRTKNDNSNETFTVYDTAHRVSIGTDAKSNISTYAYDANNNVLQVDEIEKSDQGNPNFSRQPINMTTSIVVLRASIILLIRSNTRTTLAIIICF
ncbi:MAG: hypothetical protein GKR87_00650 [Kiritimatiellae bacterium]|nr:hypothetical protein [Kiritimatiellia bacterium]